MRCEGFSNIAIHQTDTRTLLNMIPQKKNNQSKSLQVLPNEVSQALQVRGEKREERERKRVRVASNMIGFCYVIGSTIIIIHAIDELVQYPSTPTPVSRQHKLHKRP